MTVNNFRASFSLLTLMLLAACQYEVPTSPERPTTCTNDKDCFYEDQTCEIQQCVFQKECAASGDKCGAGLKAIIKDDGKGSGACLCVPAATGTLPIGQQCTMSAQCMTGICQDELCVGSKNQTCKKPEECVTRHCASGENQPTDLKRCTTACTEADSGGLDYVSKKGCGGPRDLMVCGPWLPKCSDGTFVTKQVVPSPGAVPSYQANCASNFTVGGGDGLVAGKYWCAANMQTGQKVYFFPDAAISGVVRLLTTHSGCMSESSWMVSERFTSAGNHTLLVPCQTSVKFLDVNNAPVDLTGKKCGVMDVDNAQSIPC